MTDDARPEVPSEPAVPTTELQEALRAERARRQLLEERRTRQLHEQFENAAVEADDVAGEVVAGVIRARHLGEADVDHPASFPAPESIPKREPNYFQIGCHHPPDTNGRRYLNLDTGQLVRPPVNGSL